MELTNPVGWDNLVNSSIGGHDILDDLVNQAAG